MSWCGRGDIEHNHQRPFAHLVADFHLHFAHRSAGGRGHIHRRLVGFERNERVLRLDLIAGFYEDLDDRDVLEVADVRHFHIEWIHGV